MVGSVVVAGGCATEPSRLAEIRSASTVDMLGAACSTSGVLGLSRQIADEISCVQPGLLVPFEAGDGLVFTSNAVLPYLQIAALNDLRAAAATTPVQINSAYRTVAQQYLLRRWHLTGKCGIAAAAPVGTSNHETGRALDLQSYSAPTMRAHGWANDIPGDTPHFDHLASADLRGEDTRAFQRLWNRNHPEDPIDEDGEYGAATEDRLKRSPALGFDIGASCETEIVPTGVRVGFPVAIEGPDRVPPKARVLYRIAFYNAGDIEWSGGTRVRLADGSSALYDDSWISSADITTLISPVGAGEVTWIDITVLTPEVSDETTFLERIVLDDDGEFAQVDLALTVVPGATEPASGESAQPGTDEGDDLGGSGSGHDKTDRPDAPTIEGGCSVGNDASGGGAALGFALFAALRRRRCSR